MLNWRAEDLWLASRELVNDLSIELLGSTGSTNADALTRLRGGDTRPCLIVAESQSAGRGRLGRTWWSAPGASLTFSLALALAPRDWGGLSLAVGLALAEALDPLVDGVTPLVDGVNPLDDGLTPAVEAQNRVTTAPASSGAMSRHGRIGVKWPNDLWLRDGERKLAGILIETTAVPAGLDVSSPWPNDGTIDGVDSSDDLSRRRHVVIGVGVNLAAEVPGGSPDVSPGPSSGGVSDTAPGAASDVPVFGSGYAGLQELDAGLDAPAALALVLPALLRTLRQFEREGLAPLQARFAQRDLLRGRVVSAGDLRGRVVGVDAEGGLLLDTGSAGVQRVVSGEVSVRPC
jgi:BirA family biotin operon repressor/biotin-[acetyl-CoA-carboxylase] ligase